GCEECDGESDTGVWSLHSRRAARRVHETLSGIRRRGPLSVTDLDRRSVLALAAMAGAGLSSSTLWASVVLGGSSPSSEPQDSNRRTAMPESTPQYPPLPPDDLNRTLTIARPDSDQ